MSYEDDDMLPHPPKAPLSVVMHSDAPNQRAEDNKLTMSYPD